MSKVFLCYRRDDAGGYAGRIQDRLVRDLGADVLFMDVDNIPLGINFVKILNDEVAKCEVLLAVIGRNWLDARDEHGNRRLDDPNDFVVIEIRAALQRDIPVVPILVEGARIPNPNQLPKELEELSVRNALNVHHSSFHGDVDRLVKGVQALLNVRPPSPQLKTEYRAKDTEAETEPPPQAEEVQTTAPQVTSPSQPKTFKTPFRWSLIIAGVIGGALPWGIAFAYGLLFGSAPRSDVPGFISIVTSGVFSGGIAGLLRVKLAIWQSTIVFFALCFLVMLIVFPQLSGPPLRGTELVWIPAAVTAVPALTTWIAFLLERWLHARTPKAALERELGPEA